MIRSAFGAFVLLVATIAGAIAQERVSVGVLRTVTNGPLFLAVTNGAFQAEGINPDIKAYATPAAIADALAKGEIDIGASSFGPELFNLAGRGDIRLIAGQAREEKNFEGNELVASNAAYANGLRKYENLPDHSLGLVQYGSSYHYQVGRIAQLKQFDLGKVVIKAMPSADALADAVVAGRVDAAILPGSVARDLLASGYARLIGWCSDLGETQLGGVFATAKMITARRAVVEKFVRAYQRGASEYAAALLRNNSSHKRVADAKAQAVAEVIGRIVYPKTSVEQAVALVENAAYAMDPQARINVDDIAQQFAWFKAQGLIDSAADARNAVDPSFTNAR
ncbi:MAG TPA: ABC transporter substrate-binding protein [Pseudolabrys sp.]|nr:ABC transporter substrate-binding protein [Pseudolabrys sp.]